MVYGVVVKMYNSKCNLLSYYNVYIWYMETIDKIELVLRGTI